MAGTKVNGYGVGDVNLTCLMATVDAQRKGFFGLSLTEFDTTAEPAVAAGGVIEVNGALYEFDTEEAISGSPSDGTVYVMVVPSGDSITAQFTNTSPAWSDSKQGWYDSTGNYRYVARMTLDSGSYANKIRYLISDMLRNEGASNILHTKIIEIGDWDMDADWNKEVEHGLSKLKIRSVQVTIRRDDDLMLINLAAPYSGSGADTGSYSIQESVIMLSRVTGGLFDSTTFDATSFNRGWVIIQYVD